MTDQHGTLPLEVEGADDAGSKDHEYITTTQACRLVGKNAASLIAMGHLDDFPLPVSVRPSRPEALFWRKSEVEAWLERNNWPPF